MLCIISDVSTEKDFFLKLRRGRQDLSGLSKQSIEFSRTVRDFLTLALFAGGGGGGVAPQIFVRSSSQQAIPENWSSSQVLLMALFAVFARFSFSGKLNHFSCIKPLQQSRRLSVLSQSQEVNFLIPLKTCLVFY